MITTLNWLLCLHIASVFALLATHGVSMVVLYGIRKERDRARIMAMVTLSGQTITPMYISIGADRLFGIVAARSSSTVRQSGSGSSIGDPGRRRSG